MSTTHQLKNALPFTNHTMFDLITFIQDIPNQDIAAQAMQSVAFRLDVLVQSNARAIFKSLRKEEQEKLPAGCRTSDTLAEIEASFAEMQHAEEVFASCGMDRASPTRIIRELLNLRDKVNESAQELTALCVDWQGNPRTFTPNDLDELFITRPDMKVSQDELSKMRAAAQFVIDEGLVEGVTFEELLKMDVDRRKEELDRMANTLASQGHVVQNFFHLAARAALKDEAESFWQLDVGVQRVLIDAARGAITREMDRAKSNRKLSSLDFMQVLGAGMKAIKTLDEVVRSPKFKQRAVEDAAVEKV